MAPRLRWSALASSVALVLFGCTSHENSTGPHSGPQPFSPAHDTSLTGTLSFTSVIIPAGVTVTASGPLTLEVSGNTQIAGTLTAPCLPLSILDSGTVTVTGSVNTGCAAVTADTAPELLILAQGGYTLQGATITASGSEVITDDTSLVNVSFSVVHSARISAQSVTAAQDVVPACHVGPPNNVFLANPARARDGVAGSPAGTNGEDGHPWALACTGELDIDGGVTATGQNGGNGGAGTTTSSATARGGSGGKGGSLRVRAAGDIVFSGQSTLTGGSGGFGGAATGTPSSAGSSASAVAGNGGNGSQNSGGTNGPVDVQAKGSITISGALAIVAGNGGAGGAATATGAPGAPGAQGGGVSKDSGGVGGITLPFTLKGSNVSGLGNVTVSGGNGGAGGKATAGGGAGGAGATPGAAGGPGGGMTANAGNGGNAQLRDQNGNLIGTGGAAGNLEFDAGIGGAGGANCPANGPGGPGGAGGGGGSASGTLGVAGTGAAAGAAASTLLNTVGNGGAGGAGTPGGAGGPAGTDGTPAPKRAVGTNFSPGPNGGPCPPPGPRTLQLINGDNVNQPWGVVAISISGGPYVALTANGNTWTVNLNQTTDSTEVTLVIAWTSGAGGIFHITSFDYPASFFLTHPATSFTGAIGGIATGTVTATTTETAGGLEQVVADPSQATAYAPQGSVSLSPLIGTSVGVGSAINSGGALPSQYSYQIATLTNGQSLNSLLVPTFSYAVAAITPPASGSIRDVYYRHWIFDGLEDGQDDGWLNMGWLATFVGNGSATQIAVASPGNLPTNTLQAIDWRIHPSAMSFTEGRQYFSTYPTGLAVTFAPAYTPPVTTAKSGTYQYFGLQGSIAAPWINGALTAQAISGSKLYMVNAYFGYETSTLNLSTPSDKLFSEYGIPLGAGGWIQYVARNYDQFIAPTDGSLRFQAGYAQSFGQVTAPTIQTSLGQSEVTAVQGSTTPLTVSASLTNGGGAPVYVASGPTSTPGISIQGTTIGPTQATAEVVLVATPQATPGTYTVPIIFTADVNGVEVSQTATIVVIVSAGG